MFADKLTLNDDIAAVLCHALDAFRRGVDETNLAPHLGQPRARKALLGDPSEGK